MYFAVRKIQWARNAYKIYCYCNACTNSYLACKNVYIYIYLWYFVCAHLNVMNAWVWYSCSHLCVYLPGVICVRMCVWNLWLFVNVECHTLANRENYHQLTQKFFCFESAHFYSFVMDKISDRRPADHWQTF